MLQPWNPPTPNALLGAALAGRGMWQLANEALWRGAVWGLLAGGVGQRLARVDASDGLLFLGRVFGGEDAATWVGDGVAGGVGDGLEDGSQSRWGRGVWAGDGDHDRRRGPEEEWDEKGRDGLQEVVCGFAVQGRFGMYGRGREEAEWQGGKAKRTGSQGVLPGVVALRKPS